MKLKKLLREKKRLDVIASLRKWDGVYEDEHFVYQSGKHGQAYINFDVAFPYVLFVMRVCWQLIKPFRKRYDVIVAPAVGGVVLAYVAGVLTLLTGRKVKVVFAEKIKDANSPGGKKFIFERQGFARKLEGKRVLVLDDIMTNDNEQGSVYKLCRLVEAHGGIVIGVSIVCNRCNGTKEGLEVPELYYLCGVDPELFWADAADSCRLCAQDPPRPIVTDIGHGAGFPEQNPDYAGGFKTLLS